MSNVVVFPRPATKSSAAIQPARPMTLFLHVKCATLIMHLADNQLVAKRGKRVSKS